MEVFFLSRLERNRQRRRRKRIKIFFIISMILCVGILIGGIYTINDIMIKTTSLPEDKNMLSIDNIRCSVDKVLSDIKKERLRIGDKIARLCDNVVQWLKDAGQFMVDNIR